MGRKRARGFTPSDVKLQHLRKIMLLYGNDTYGIKLRLETFKRVLEEAHSKGETKSAVFSAKNMSEGIGLIETGNIFVNGSINIIIDDASDMLANSPRSNSDEQNALTRRFEDAVKKYDSTDDAHIIIGLPFSSDNGSTESYTKLVYKLRKSIENHSGLIREVSIESDRSLKDIAMMYSHSLGLELSENDIENMLVVCRNVDDVATAMSSLGNSLENMTPNQILLMLSARKDEAKSVRVTHAEMLDMIASGDAYNIAMLASTALKIDNGSGCRTLLTSIRHACLELSIAACGGASALAEFRTSSAFMVRKIKTYPPRQVEHLVKSNRLSKEQLVKTYCDVEHELENIVGMDSSRTSYKHDMRESMMKIITDISLLKTRDESIV